MASLHRRAFYLAGTIPDADDILQQAIVDAFVAFGTLRDQSRFGSWMRGFVGRRWQQFAGRARRRRQVPLDLAEHEDLSVVAGGMETWVLAMDLEAALSRLSPIHRRAIEQAHRGLSYEEAARESGCPVGTYRSRLNRARRLLLEELEGPRWDATTKRRRAAP